MFFNEHNIAKQNVSFGLRLIHFRFPAVSMDMCYGNLQCIVTILQSAELNYYVWMFQPLKNMYKIRKNCVDILNDWIKLKCSYFSFY